MKSIDALIKGLLEAKEELVKAIKPGPALNYAAMNPKPDRAAQEAAAPTINYGNNRMSAPKWSGAADKASAVRTKLDAEAKESGLDTIARRQKMGKGDGNVGDETFKDDSMGGGFAMSEKDEGTPEHENKEKKIGQKVKEEAQELLDMHKGEVLKIDLGGQWKIEPKGKSSKSTKGTNEE